MNKLLAFLKSAKILDQDETLSLSNVAMMVIIGRLALAQGIDWATLAAFFLALLNHNARKHWAGAKASKEITDTERLAQLEKHVEKLNQTAQAKRL